MKNGKRSIKTSSIFWGLLLILAAVFLIASQFGFFQQVDTFGIIFAIFWVAILIEGLIRGSFGAMKVFFDNAMIQNGNATIELEVSFGGVELYFPKHWSVVNQTDTVFGGLDEKNHSSSAGSPVVTLTGDINFAGVTIIYV